MKAHWMESADYVSSGDTRIIGQDENGDLYVPSKTRPDYWDRRFNPLNPTHWSYYVRSRITKRVAFLEGI